MPEICAFQIACFEYRSQLGGEGPVGQYPFDAGDETCGKIGLLTRARRPQLGFEQIRGQQAEAALNRRMSVGAFRSLKTIGINADVSV